MATVEREEGGDGEEKVWDETERNDDMAAAEVGDEATPPNDAERDELWRSDNSVGETRVRNDSEQNDGDEPARSETGGAENFGVDCDDWRSENDGDEEHEEGGGSGGAAAAEGDEEKVAKELEQRQQQQDVGGLSHDGANDISDGDEKSDVERDGENSVSDGAASEVDQVTAEMRTEARRRKLAARLGALRRFPTRWDAAHFESAREFLTPDLVRRALLRILLQTTATAERESDFDELVAWCDVAFRDPLADARPACRLPSALWSHVLTWCDVPEMERVVQMSHEFRRVAQLPSSWSGSCHLAELGRVELRCVTSLRAFVHTFPDALRSTSRLSIRVAPGLVFDRFADLFRYTCRHAPPPPPPSPQHRDGSKGGVNRNDDDDDDDDDAATKRPERTVTVSAVEQCLWFPGIGSRDEPSSSRCTAVTRRIRLLPNTTLRELDTNGDLTEEDARLTSRLFPSLTRLRLTNAFPTASVVGALLRGPTRLAAFEWCPDACVVEFGQASTGVSWSEMAAAVGVDGRAVEPRRATIEVPAAVRRLAFSVTDEQDWHLERDEPNRTDYWNTQRTWLAVDAQRNARLESLHVGDSRHTRLCHVAQWPAALRSVTLAGGVLAPRTRLIDVMRLPSLETLVLRHMVLTDAVVFGGGEGDSPSLSSSSSSPSLTASVGSDPSRTIDTPEAPLQFPNMTRVDLERCAVDNAFVRFVLAAYPRLASLRIDGAPTRRERELVPLDLDQVLTDVAGASAFVDGHLRYLQAPVGDETFAFGPPNDCARGGAPVMDAPSDPYDLAYVQTIAHDPTAPQCRVLAIERHDGRPPDVRRRTAVRRGASAVLVVPEPRLGGGATGATADADIHVRIHDPASTEERYFGGATDYAQFGSAATHTRVVSAMRASVYWRPLARLMSGGRCLVGFGWVAQRQQPVPSITERCQLPSSRASPSRPPSPSPSTTATTDDSVSGRGVGGDEPEPETRSGDGTLAATATPSSTPVQFCYCTARRRVWSATGLAFAPPLPPPQHGTVLPTSDALGSSPVHKTAVRRRPPRPAKFASRPPPTSFSASSSPSYSSPLSSASAIQPSAQTSDDDDDRRREILVPLAKLDSR